MKDPYLGPNPSLGACLDLPKKVRAGDHIFTISGKVDGVPQYVMGGFEVERKISAIEAYALYPERRLYRCMDGQLDGNIVVDATGQQHPLDTHKSKTFTSRVQNYVVGKNPIALVTPGEIARGREQTLDMLCRILVKSRALRTKSSVSLVKNSASTR